MTHKKAIRQHYQPRLAPDRPSHEILDWSSAEAQQLRLRTLCRNVDLVGKTLLDVGCGLGDLWALLKAGGIQVDYTGIDLLDTMVAAARARHPHARFLVGDLFADSAPGGPIFEPASFDIVFASGVFNLNLGNNLAFLTAAIPRLLGLAREAVVITLLHQRGNDGDTRYYFYHPATVLPLLRDRGWDVDLLDDYLPHDFTLIARRPAAARRSSCATCTNPACDQRST